MTKMSQEEIDEKYKKIKAFSDQDTRKPEEIFAAMCDRLRQLAVENGGPAPTDQELEQGVRRLIGLCEIIMENVK